MTKKYFWAKATGLNADIERHRAEKEMLLKKIEACDETELMGRSVKRSYQNLLYALEDSLAELVTKLGKKK